MVPEARHPCVPPAPDLNTHARGARRSPPRLQRRRPAGTPALEAPDAARLAPGRSRGRGPPTRHQASVASSSAGCRTTACSRALHPSFKRRWHLRQLATDGHATQACRPVGQPAGGGRGSADRSRSRLL